MTYIAEFEDLVRRMRNHLAILHENGMSWPDIERAMQMSHATVHRFRRDEAWRLSMASFYKVARWLDSQSPHPTP